MFLQNQPRSVWMVPYALFKCNSHCFSVFWPGCHDTQRLLYFVTHSFCGSAQSPTGPIVLVPFPCAAPPLQCVAMVSHTVLLPQLMCKSSPGTRAPCQGVTSFHCLCCSLFHIAVPQLSSKTEVPSNVHPSRPIPTGGASYDSAFPACDS